jgi:hypothetical protein
LFINVSSELAGNFDLLQLSAEAGQTSAAGHSGRSIACPLTVSCGCYSGKKKVAARTIMRQATAVGADGTGGGPGGGVLVGAGARPRADGAVRLSLVRAKRISALLAALGPTHPGLPRGTPSDHGEVVREVSPGSGKVEANKE